MSYYLMGQGSIYLAKRDINGAALGYRLLGNCSEFTLGLGKGGLQFVDGVAVVPEGQMPTFRLALQSLEAENIALIMAGSNTTVNAGSTTTTRVKAYKGCLTPLPHIGLTAFTSLVNDSTSAAYQLGRDYTVNIAAGSLVIPANSTIPDGTLVRASYAYGAHVVQGAYTANSDFYSLYFEGINTAANNEPVTLDIFKTKIDPVDDLPLIGDNIATLQVAGKMFYDNQMAVTPVEGRLLRLRRK